MELVVGTNCYTDINDANQLIADNFMSSNPIKKVWDSLQDEDKTVLIYSSTQLCDKDSILYKGYKADINQPLQFPRCAGVSIEVPELVKLGILVQGIKQYIVDSGSSGDFEALQANGIKSFADGSAARVEFANATDLKTSSNYKNNLGLFNDVFKKYFIQYTKIV